MILRCIAFTLTVLVLNAPQAFAACANPPAEAGTQIYNSTYDVMQYCNGTRWIAMGAAAGSDTLAGLECNEGDTIRHDGNEWACVAATAVGKFVDGTNPNNAVYMAGRVGI